MDRYLREYFLVFLSAMDGAIIGALFNLTVNINFSGAAIFLLFSFFIIITIFVGLIAFRII